MRNPQNRAMRAAGLVALVGTMLVGGAVTATGAGTLDQQQTNANLGLVLATNQSLAQTFTAGITGDLDHADLLLSKQGNPPSPTVTVEIRTTAAGIPTGTVLATGTIALADVPTQPTFAFVSVLFAQPASVTAGTQYALVAYNAGTGGNSVAWNNDLNNSYSGGQLFASGDPVPPGPGTNWTPFPADAAFKTYVTPPAPPSAVAQCNGLKATITGTSGDDVIAGTAGNDVIVAGDGEDIVRADGGNDVVCGGDGDDILKGGRGKDVLFGESGGDTLKGGAQNDRCVGGFGVDRVKKCERSGSL